MQKFIGLWVISMLILTGCGGGGSTTPDTEPPQISQIEIEHAGDAVQVFATVQDAMPAGLQRCRLWRVSA
jgi:hypothetical protein